MTDDLYCDEALSGRTPVRVVEENEHVLAFHHTSCSRSCAASPSA
jgi:histidine triad (HIT) family protein